MTNKIKLINLLSCCLILGISNLAFAQEELPEANKTEESTETTISKTKSNNADVETEEQDKLYKGIIPGMRNIVNHVKPAVAKGQDDSTPNQLTWVGFQPEKTRTRVFFQIASVPSYQMTRSDDKTTITLTLPNTKISTPNVTRPVHAEAYKRDVTYIKARRGKKKTVVIKLKVSATADPQISQSGNFLYVDFAHTEKEDKK